jgi:nucleotidyltransferase substrate binding protein (TIGR01987 family)
LAIVARGDGKNPQQKLWKLLKVFLRRINDLNCLPTWRIIAFKGLKRWEHKMNTDIRWKQRFQNFVKALKNLEEALAKTDLSKLEKAGVIQIYEFTFELAWKTLKDFLEEKGVDVKFPRDTIKEAFKYELVDDGELWLDMLQKRNLMAHTYDENTAELAFRLIADQYVFALKQVHDRLEKSL